MTPGEEEVREEHRRVRTLRTAVDLALAVIRQDPGLELREALGMARAVQSLALGLFPDKEETYDLIYRPRFRRALEERFGVRFAGDADIPSAGPCSPGSPDSRDENP